MADEKRYDDVPPEEYAAWWGCDPVYDRYPRFMGDGYLFYNFAIEGYDPAFLKEFLSAIDRTIAGAETAEDIEDLESLKDEVAQRLVQVVV